MGIVRSIHVRCAETSSMTNEGRRWNATSLFEKIMIGIFSIECISNGLLSLDLLLRVETLQYGYHSEV